MAANPQMSVADVAKTYGNDVAQAFVEALKDEATKELKDLAQKLVDPIGAAKKEAEKASKEQKQAASDHAKAMGDIAKKVSAAGGVASKGIGGLEGALSALGPEAMVAGVAIGATIGAISALTSSILGLVKVSNPALVEQYEAAWDDLWGVLGQSLEPVVELMTDGVRMLADYIASNIDPIEKMIKAVVDFGRAVGDTIAEVISAIKSLPGGNLMLAAAGGTNPVLGAIGVAGLLGMDKYNKGASVGAAAGQTSYKTLEGLGESARLASFRQGGRSASDQREKQITLLEEIARKKNDNDPHGARRAIASDNGEDFQGTGGDYGV